MKVDGAALVGGENGGAFDEEDALPTYGNYPSSFSSSS